MIRPPSRATSSSGAREGGVAGQGKGLGPPGTDRSPLMTGSRTCRRSTTPAVRRSPRAPTTLARSRSRSRCCPRGDPTQVGALAPCMSTAVPPTASRRARAWRSPSCSASAATAGTKASTGSPPIQSEPARGARSTRTGGEQRRQQCSEGARGTDMDRRVGSPGPGLNDTPVAPGLLMASGAGAGASRAGHRAPGGSSRRDR